jgi:hypothetical protein
MSFFNNAFLAPATLNALLVAASFAQLIGVLCTSEAKQVPQNFIEKDFLSGTQLYTFAYFF